MTRLVAVALLILVASGASGQRLYLPAGASSGGATLSATWASGDTRVLGGVVFSPTERVDARAFFGEESSDDPTRRIVGGGLTVYLQPDGTLTVPVSLDVFGSPKAAAVWSAAVGVSQPVAAGPALAVVPRAEFRIETALVDVDPTVILSGAVGFRFIPLPIDVQTAPPSGFLGYVEPALGYDLERGRIRMGFVLGGSFYF